MTPPVISVVIPVHNQQHEVQRCLASVLSQSFTGIEVLLIDDGSTDGTLAQAMQLACTDARLQVHSQANQGAGAARNHGLRLAKGQYVHFLDADDELRPGAYAGMVALAAKWSGLDMLLFQYTEADTASGTLTPVDLFGLAEADSRQCALPQQRHLLLQTSVVPWNKLLRREFLQQAGARFDETRFANDRSFHFQVATASRQVALSGARWVCHRVNHPQSLTGRAGAERVAATLEAFASTTRLARGLPEADQRCIFDRNMANLAWEFNRAAHGQKPEVARLVTQWLQTAPLPFAPAEFAQTSWYPAFAVMRSVHGCASKAETVFPVAMATDEKYAPFLEVALQSVSSTLKQGEFCAVHVLHTGLRPEVVQHLEQGLGHANVGVCCIDLSALADWSGVFSRAHYSAEMYLRLWIPELLSAFPKVLYLDCDVVVRRSLGELFQTDLGNHALAGVRDFNNAGHRQYVQSALGLKAEGYVNSGVLLFDTARCLASGFRQRCLKVLETHEVLSCPDQDMINVAAAGDILLLDSGWNYQWHYDLASPPDGVAWFEADLANARGKQYIVHYTSAIKPWLYPLYAGAEAFWACARQTPAHVRVCHAGLKTKGQVLLRRLQEIRANGQS